MEQQSEPVARQRRVRKAEVRARILAAARELFASRGFDRVSLEQIAEAAGFSKGAVYSNFAGKDELFFELAESIVDERIDVLRRSAAARTDDDVPLVPRLSDLARRIGAELGAIGRADPAWQRLSLEFWLRGHGNPELHQRLTDKRRLLHARIAEVFQAETRAAGIELSGADAHTLALAVVALSNGLGFESIIDADAVPPDLLGELFSRLVGGMLAQSGLDGDPTAET